MLHHHHGGGTGSPYLLAPATAGTASPFSPPPTGPVSATAVVPPPPTSQLQPAGGASANFEAVLPAGGAGAGASAAAAQVLLQDDDMQTDAVPGAAGAGGTRWPREETLALIRIRTEMDADFRNAPLKAPLWEDVARKLAGLGYHRSAKKCKEKFENVDKYYRRTKDARAGRQGGKSYRFFPQLEALHAQQPPAAPAAAGPSSHQPMAMAWPTGPTLGRPAGLLPDLSFSSMSESDSEYESGSDGDSDALEGEEGGVGGCDRDMVAIFEGMMKQVTEKQDAMHRLFLETLERWECERTAREEAWRRQEVARINREREQLARERAAAASRDAALIAFLQRVGGGQGQPLRLPPHAAAAAAAAAVPAAAPTMPGPSPRHDTLQLVPAPPKPEEASASAWAGGEGGGSAPSRWPKEEVQALIQMRTEKDETYHDAGAKGPLWEDIAAGMRRIGYNRSAKRCKEKWENINKYYKKVKESNKRRPEDSKTCPYFHQLDAMYRKKRFAGGGSSSTAPAGASVAAVTVAVAVKGKENHPNQRELEGKSSNDVDKWKNEGHGDVHAPPGAGNDETAPATTVSDDSAKNKMAEDFVKETNVQLQQQQFGGDETDSDDNDMEGRCNYTEEGNDQDKMKCKMGLQKPNAIGSSGDVPAPPGTATAPTSSAAPTSSTFLAVK
ncbi:hypothetical protein BS78_04G212900 [Paspalum vaginatum]|nr:hypothetical protein BS78_04G212900 [Paspalum vaginatum]KAJ1280198.1 hypothetical protein BS78_04G212900 [Paspalum vaginatum]